MKFALSTAVLVATLSGAAWAQTRFELPRECRERHGFDPERCVIQDGQPADPWVRKKPPAVTPPSAPPPPPAANAPGARTPPRAAR